MLWCETTQNLNNDLVRILRILDKNIVTIASSLTSSAVILLLKFLGKFVYLAFVVRLQTLHLCNLYVFKIKCFHDNRPDFYLGKIHLTVTYVN
jgi:hypothetical protein